MCECSYSSDLLCAHGSRKVLLVSKHKKTGSGQPLRWHKHYRERLKSHRGIFDSMEELSNLLHEEGVKLSPTVLQSPTVCAVHNPYQTIRGLKVVSPVRPKRLLTSHVPDVEVESGLE